MSYSTLYYVYGTKVRALKTYHNSHGTASVLWDFLAERYLGKRRGFCEDQQPLWNLSLSPDVPRPFRMVLEWTFDRWVCPFPLLPELAASCAIVGTALLATYPTFVNHWPRLASDVGTLARPPGPAPLGLGLGCTSVSDPWEDWRPGQEPVYLLEPDTVGTARGGT